MGNKELLKKVNNFSVFLAKRYKLKRVYLFGSLAEGLFLKGSDVDIALEGMDFEDYLKALAEHRFVRGMHLDMLNMDFCRPEIKEAILKSGLLLYEKK